MNDVRVNVASKKTGHRDRDEPDEVRTVRQTQLDVSRPREGMEGVLNQLSRRTREVRTIGRQRTNMFIFRMQQGLRPHTAGASLCGVVVVAVRTSHD